MAAMSHFKIGEDVVELKIAGETIEVPRADNAFWCLGAQRAGELILAALEEDWNIQTREDFIELIAEFLRDLEIVRANPPKVRE